MKVIKNKNINKKLIFLNLKGFQMHLIVKKCIVVFNLSIFLILKHSQKLMINQSYM